jgi:hypothetical protein
LPEIRWRKQGGALPWGRTTFDNYGKTLIIKHVDFEDAGDYTCESSNGVGIAKSYSISLEVFAKPRFLVEPTYQTAAEGEEVMFECKADGKPAPRIKWIHNGKNIEDAPYNPNRIVTPDRIIIKNLRKTDTGNYGCNATNEVGYVYKDVYINVLGKDLVPFPSIVNWISLQFPFSASSSSGNYGCARKREAHRRRTDGEAVLPHFRRAQAHRQVVPRQRRAHRRKIHHHHRRRP